MSVLLISAGVQFQLVIEWRKWGGGEVVLLVAQDHWVVGRRTVCGSIVGEKGCQWQE